MTIDVQRPELQALIQQRMMSGAFATVEDALIQALEAAPFPAKKISAADRQSPIKGFEILSAMQASPVEDFDFGSDMDSVPEPIRRRSVAEAVAGIRELRKGNFLDGLSVKDLINEGRRF